VEVAARREWAKMCRSVSLKGAGKNAPDLWMEMRPIRAFAAQPRIEAEALVITLGVEAETRVMPAQTAPSCPFPRELAIVPPLEDGRIAVAVPIDMPFTEVDRILAAQMVGRDFSAPGAPVAATVLAAQVTPAGDRLLISLRVKAREQTSWFGLGAEATINVWGRPVLDPAMQILRLADISLDVDSQVAFGLLGAAARAAIPYLQKAIEDAAKLDLAPFAADARRAIEASLADFRRNAAGVEVAASITSVRLAALAFDATTLRVIAEAEGSAKVAITSLVR
jgi:predicted small integral membrane protein